MTPGTYGPDWIAREEARGAAHARRIIEQAQEAARQDALRSALESHDDANMPRGERG